ncbi:MAG: low molecular weight phosphotyrosine protein phosphatase, partial [Runella slithyformis]
FDYLIAMDESNFENIEALFRRSTGLQMPEDRLFLYRDFDPQADTSEVPDPYYEDIAAFEEVYQIVERCGQNFLQYLAEKHNLA